MASHLFTIHVQEQKGLYTPKHSQGHTVYRHTHIRLFSAPHVPHISEMTKKETKSRNVPSFQVESDNFDIRLHFILLEDRNSKTNEFDHLSYQFKAKTLDSREAKHSVSAYIVFDTHSSKKHDPYTTNSGHRSNNNIIIMIYLCELFHGFVH